jgi:hypothetical protein
MTWRDEWEKHAHWELESYDAQPVPDLIKFVKNGYYGTYYVIWDSIARRGTLVEAGWTLFAVLELEVDYLYRYHAAAALLKLMGDEKREPVDLSSTREGIKERLAEVKRELTQRLGPPPLT